MPHCGQCRAPIPAGAPSCPLCGLTLSGNVETLPGTGAHQGYVEHDPLIGRSVIDQYIIRSKIGEGGMGAVYLAEQPSVGRNAVIKVLHPWLSHKLSARFATEARAAARLQNPHIVSIYNYGKMADGTLFLAMEHLSGCNLAQLIRKHGRIEPGRAVAITRQCCEALGHAHRRGVIHRDLKPSNIMLLQRGGGPDFVKLLDFGIAKLDGTEHTTAGSMLGTPRYMSPEQLTGKPADARSDIYAVALILYEMLVGRPPFEASNPAGYMYQHLNQQPPTLMQAAPDLRVPPAVEACLLRALAKEPHQRPMTADIFAEELWSAMMATLEKSFIVLPSRPVRKPSRLLVAGAVTTAALMVVAGASTAYLLHESSDAPAAPRSAQVTTNPVAADPSLNSPTPPPPPPTSPEKAALMDKSVSELEAELQRVTILSGLPRESVELALADYHKAAADPPRGLDSKQYRKALLADLILTWREQGAHTPSEDLSLNELEAVFLAMPSHLDVRQRAEMLHQLKITASRDRARQLNVRNKLIEWIDVFGADDELIELEIFEEDSDGTN